MMHILLNDTVGQCKFWFRWNRHMLCSELIFFHLCCKSVKKFSPGNLFVTSFSGSLLHSSHKMDSPRQSFEKWSLKMNEFRKEMEKEPCGQAWLARWRISRLPPPRSPYQPEFNQLQSESRMFNLIKGFSLGRWRFRAVVQNLWNLGNANTWRFRLADISHPISVKCGPKKLPKWWGDRTWPTKRQWQRQWQWQWQKQCQWQWLKTLEDLVFYTYHTQ